MSVLLIVGEIMGRFGVNNVVGKAKYRARRTCYIGNHLGDERKTARVIIFRCH